VIVKEGMREHRDALPPGGGYHCYRRWNSGCGGGRPPRGGRAHLEQDLEKLRNSEVPYAYVVHFSRLPADGKVEDLLTAAYPNIRTAYAHVPPTGGREVKHLTDTGIIRSE
jgi:hypothetical protein